MSTNPQARSKACPENITVPVGTPFITSEAVFWPGVTLNIRFAVRDGADAISWMQRTPAGALKRASTRASAFWSIFCSGLLQARATAAATSAVSERVDIWNPPDWDVDCGIAQSEAKQKTGLHKTDLERRPTCRREQPRRKVPPKAEREVRGGKFPGDSRPPPEGGAHGPPILYSRPAGCIWLHA